jgi:hypothetical protein
VNCRCFLEEVVEGVALRGNALVWAGEWYWQVRCNLLIMG